jgi:hypothetical protein
MWSLSIITLGIRHAVVNAFAIAHNDTAKSNLRLIQQRKKDSKKERKKDSKKDRMNEKKK